MVKTNNLDYAIMRKNLAKNAKYSDKLSHFRNAALGLATAATMATGNPAVAGDSPSPAAQQQTEQAQPAFNPEVRKQNILRSISHVESSGGKNVQHAKLPEDGIHRGERAFGSYGLTPVLIRETAKRNKTIRENHPELHKLRGSSMHKYMQQNPNLEHKIASAHYDRLANKFGHDPSKIGFAWLNGITGTMRALKRNVDLDNHWHVKKINKAFHKIRSSQGK